MAGSVGVEGLEPSRLDFGPGFAMQTRRSRPRACRVCSRSLPSSDSLPQALPQVSSLVGLAAVQIVLLFFRLHWRGRLKAELELRLIILILGLVVQPPEHSH